MDNQKQVLSVFPHLLRAVFELITVTINRHDPKCDTVRQDKQFPDRSLCTCGLKLAQARVIQYLVQYKELLPRGYTPDTLLKEAYVPQQQEEARLVRND